MTFCWHLYDNGIKRNLIDCVDIQKTSETAKPAFQWIFVLNSVKQKFFSVSIVNSHIETGDVVNTNEMAIVHEESDIFAYLPSFVEAKKCAENLTNSTKGVVQAKDEIKRMMKRSLRWNNTLEKEFI